MKTRQLLISASFLSLLGMNACTNGFEDMDILDYDSKSDWQQELNYLLMENEPLFNNSRLTFLKAEPIVYEELDSSSFFNEKTLIPTYINGTEKFELLPLDYIREDSLTKHVKYGFINWKVNHLLKTGSYNAVELYWDFNGHQTKTIALFNKKSNELEYDNILFNVLNNNIKNKKARLTRTEVFEPTNWGSNYDIVYFYNHSGVAAFSWYGWADNYNWEPVVVGYDSISGNPITDYQYHHYSLIFRNDTWTLDDDYYAISTYRDVSMPYYAALFVYTYVGPNMYKPSELDIESYLNNPPGNLQPGGMENMAYVIPAGNWIGCWVESRLEFFLDSAERED